MTNIIMSGLKWAFGKDGSTVSQYILIILLISYKETLISLNVPEAAIFTAVGIILNLNNNALKQIITSLQVKFQKADTINQLVKFGMDFASAITAVEEPTVKTEFVAKPDKSPFIEPIAPLELKKE
jgi:hypothetical protein